MILRTALAVGIALSTMTAQAEEKANARPERLGDIPQKSIVIAPMLSSADTCFLHDYDSLAWILNDWVTGEELYKGYIDPSHSCENPYPFTVTAINMPMYFGASAEISASVDVEAVDDTSIAGCTIPGALLAISSEWTATVPGEGLWNIWVPLDEPLMVEGPFFAGFYISNAIDTSAGAAVLTDDNPVLCTSYNIWDEQVGWVDLCDPSFPGFPGRLVIEAAGIPGGAAAPEPEVEVVSPTPGATLYGSHELWAWDKGMSGQIEYAVFEYSSGGGFTEIGRDFDGSSPLRNGVNGTTAGTGFSLDWDFSSLPEGTYNVWARLVTTEGTSIGEIVTVNLVPTVAIAEITTPGDGAEFCTPLRVSMSATDAALTAVTLYEYPAAAQYSNGLTAMNQTAVGDANGNLYDGNRASNGEFGDYYCGPVAAAIAAKEWYDRGRTSLMMDGATTMTMEAVAESLATEFGTRQALGTYDEAMMAGFARYSAKHGSAFAFDRMRAPRYRDLRSWAQERGHVVLLGVGGSPGAWLTLDGFDGWQNSDSTYDITVADPLVGTVHAALWRDNSPRSEIDFNGSWQPVDIMISTAPVRVWNVPRTIIGNDLSGLDGWELTWAPGVLTQGDWYFFRSIGLDSRDRSAIDVVLAEYDCSSFYVKGDYDNDQVTSLSDLALLIAYVSQGGAAPYGGAQRADCNCDNLINVADIVYYMNYLYGAASPPCR